MGSVVTKNVGAYEIWAGNPARFIRKRFEDVIIEKMKDIDFSILSNEELGILSIYIQDPDRFAEEYNKL